MSESKQIFSDLIAGIDRFDKWFRKVIFRTTCFTIWFFGIAINELALAVVKYPRADLFDIFFVSFMFASGIFQLWYLRRLILKRRVNRAFRANLLRLEAAESDEDKKFFAERCEHDLKSL